MTPSPHSVPAMQEEYRSKRMVEALFPEAARLAEMERELRLLLTANVEVGEAYGIVRARS